MSTFNQENVAGTTASEEEAKAADSTEQSTETKQDDDQGGDDEGDDQEGDEAGQSTDTAEEIEHQVEEALDASPAHGSQAAATNGLQTDASGHDPSKL